MNTKLELELQNTKFDELELTFNVLQHTDSLVFKFGDSKNNDANGSYTSKSPKEIVTDYLTKICECARKFIDEEQIKRTKTPVDVVITVPVVCSRYCDGDI